MGNHQINRLAFKVAALALLAVTLFAGCSRTPMGVEVENEPAEPQLLTRSSSISGSPLMSSGTLYTEAIISADTGGVLTLLDVTLSIPEEAVPNDTLFSISIPDPNVFYNEFGTDGLVFDNPVEVTMSYRDADLSGIDESTIRIVWVNESTGKFHDVQCEIDFDNQTVTGSLDHFSAYGLISD